jgi:hypothetical protein
MSVKKYLTVFFSQRRETSQLKGKANPEGQVKAARTPHLGFFMTVGVAFCATHLFKTRGLHGRPRSEIDTTYIFTPPVWDTFDD